jgi:hypothetical protein
MELRFRNVNDAFRRLVTIFAAPGDPSSPLNPPVVKESSRNGDVLRIAEPVLITYEKPRERVLFNHARDANPFALLMEALWMLAGRNDVASLAYYTKHFKEYSDDGKRLNGAYGDRWRHAICYSRSDDMACHPTEDQLDIIVAHLKAQPNSRRAVLSMWNVDQDLLKIGTSSYPCCEAVQRVERVPGDATTLIGGKCTIHGTTTHDNGSKDVCRNLSVLFSLRKCGSGGCLGGGYVPTDGDDNTCDVCNGKGRFLDVTVTSRSNDMVWGILGANYMTFSVLVEYVAARLGVEVGRYHHFTNNLYVYGWNFSPREWSGDTTPDFYQDFNLSGLRQGEKMRSWGKSFTTMPLVYEPAVFEKELPVFVEHFSGKIKAEELADHWDEPFLNDVAQPMMIAWACHKVQNYHGAFACCGGIEADDWRIACEAWLRRRAARRELKEASRE